MKVILANEPRLTRQLLRTALEKRGGIEVVGEEIDPVQLLLCVARTSAEAVIVTCPDDGEQPGICSHLLMEYPEIPVIGVSRDLSRVVTYRLVISEESSPAASVDGLVEAIRRAAEKDQMKTRRSAE